MNAVSCRKTKALLPEYGQNLLTPEESRRVTGHLEHCRACAQEFAGVRESWETLEAFEPVALPAYFLPKLHNRLAAAPRGAKMFPSWAWAMVLLMLAVLTAALILWPPGSNMDSNPASGYLSLELGSHPDLVIESLSDYLPVSEVENLPEFQADNTATLTLGTHEILIQMLD